MFNNETKKEDLILKKLDDIIMNQCKIINTIKEIENKVSKLEKEIIYLKEVL